MHAMISAIRLWVNASHMYEDRCVPCALRCAPWESVGVLRCQLQLRHASVHHALIMHYTSARYCADKGGGGGALAQAGLGCPSSGERGLA